MLCIAHVLNHMQLPPGYVVQCIFLPDIRFTPIQVCGSSTTGKASHALRYGSITTSAPCRSSPCGRKRCPPHGLPRTRRCPTMPRCAAKTATAGAEHVGSPHVPGDGSILVRARPASCDALQLLPREIRQRQVAHTEEGARLHAGRPATKC